MLKYLRNALSEKYLALFTSLILMCLHYWSAYPGGMTSDSLDQFEQSILWEFHNIHPIGLSFYWALLGTLHKGTSLLLFSNIACLWISVIILYFAFRNINPLLAWSFFFIIFIPSVLWQTPMLWKDIAAGGFMFLSISIATYYTIHVKQVKLYTIVISLFFTLLAFLSKFQIQFIMPIIIFWLLQCYRYKAKILRNIFFTAITILVFFNVLKVMVAALVPYPVTNTGTHRQIYDIIGISVRLNKNLIPECVTNMPSFSWEKTVDFYKNARSQDAFLFDPKYKSFRIGGLKEDEKKEVENAFFKLILSHPNTYLSHRLANFKALLKSNYGGEYGYTEPWIAERIGLPLYNVRVKSNINNYINYFADRKVTGNLVSFILIFLNIIIGMCSYKYKKKESIIVLYINLIALVFAFAMFFTTITNDYRYFFLVRLLTHFSLPISLFLFIQKISNKLDISKK